jgi:hypothetical protein
MKLEFHGLPGGIASCFELTAVDFIAIQLHIARQYHVLDKAVVLDIEASYTS